MAQELEAMLDQLEEVFDLTFEEKSDRESTSTKSLPPPKNNPEYNSPENSTNCEPQKADSPHL